MTISTYTFNINGNRTSFQRILYSAADMKGVCTFCKIEQPICPQLFQISTIQSYAGIASIMDKTITISMNVKYYFCESCIKQLKEDTQAFTLKYRLGLL